MLLACFSQVCVLVFYLEHFFRQTSLFGGGKQGANHVFMFMIISFSHSFVQMFGWVMTSWQLWRCADTSSCPAARECFSMTIVIWVCLWLSPNWTGTIVINHQRSSECGVFADMFAIFRQPHAALSPCSSPILWPFQLQRTNQWGTIRMAAVRNPNTRVDVFQ